MDIRKILEETSKKFDKKPAIIFEGKVSLVFLVA